MVLKSLNSSQDYKFGIKEIREKLSLQNRETADVYLDTILSILADKTAAPDSRFFALYSLKTTTESDNTMLISQLFQRSDSLRILQEQATFDKDKEFPHRGETFFSAQPTQSEKAAGSNYLALLLAVIKYWNMKYGATTEGIDNPPRSLFSTLLTIKMVPFPEEYRFYNIPKQINQDGEMIKIANEKMMEIKEFMMGMKLNYEENKEVPLELDYLAFFLDALMSFKKDLSEKTEYFKNNNTSVDPILYADMREQLDGVDLLIKWMNSFISGES